VYLAYLATYAVISEKLRNYIMTNFSRPY